MGRVAYCAGWAFRYVEQQWISEGLGSETVNRLNKGANSQMDYDRDAIYSLPSVPKERTPDAKASCGHCGRKMHKTLLMPGSPTEWHHDSTGHAISWSPARHTAGLYRVRVHAHRWERQAAHENVLRCQVTACDSELLDSTRAKVHAPMTEKELHIAESRRRGGEMRRAQTTVKKAS